MAKLHIIKKATYGQDLYYPNCLTSKLLLEFTRRTKTFTKKDIDTMRKLGYELVMVEKPRTEKL